MGAPLVNIFISESVSLILKDKIWRFLTTRITDTYITCISMLGLHILCLLHTVQVWSIVYLLSGHAKCLSLDKRTSPHFLYLITSYFGDWIGTQTFINNGKAIIIAVCFYPGMHKCGSCYKLFATRNGVSKIMCCIKRRMPK